MFEHERPGPGSRHDHEGEGDRSPAGSEVSYTAQSLLHLQRTAGNAAVVATVRRDTAPVEPDTARQLHVQASAAFPAERTFLKEAVDEAAEQKDDVRLANAAEWVKTKRTTLYAAVATPDSAMRVTHKGMDPAAITAWFPKASATSNSAIDATGTVQYAWNDLDDDAGTLEFEKRDAEGWALKDAIVVTNPVTRGKDQIWEVLKHEVQHASDGSTPKMEAIAAAAGKEGEEGLALPDVALERYKTEFRAYRYEGFVDKDTKPLRWGDRTWPINQYRTFLKIYSGYPYVTAAWDDDATLSDGTKFRDAVFSYVNPDSEGLNKLDSVRVDDLSKAMAAVTAPTADEANDAVQKVLGVIDRLSEAEAVSVLDGPDWQKLLDSKLSDQARTAAADRLKTKAQRS